VVCEPERFGESRFFQSALILNAKVKAIAYEVSIAKP
jgi:hypothetical protein